MFYENENESGGKKKNVTRNKTGKVYKNNSINTVMWRYYFSPFITLRYCFIRIVLLAVRRRQNFSEYNKIEAPPHFAGERRPPLRLENVLWITILSATIFRRKKPDDRTDNTRGVQRIRTFAGIFPVLGRIVFIKHLFTFYLTAC